MTLRHAALGLLAQKEGSGYDLLHRFQESLAHVWPATQSQLYTELNKMAAQGAIEVVDTGPRGRKVYGVTEAGRKELVAWLVEPDNHDLRSAILLKVFLMDLLPDRQVRAAFARIRQTSEKSLAELERMREATDWEASGLARFGRVTLELGIRTHRNRIDWCDWALDYLRLS